MVLTSGVILHSCLEYNKLSINNENRILEQINDCLTPEYLVLSIEKILRNRIEYVFK